MANKTILITGARSPVALEWARSFHSIGCLVIVADSVRFPVTRWSTCVDKFIYTISPVYNFEGFLSQLKLIIEKENVTDLLPVNEETFYISKIKNELDCRVWTSDFSLLNTLHRKDFFIDFAKEHFAVPNTTVEIGESILLNSEEYVFKAKFSRFASQIFIRPKSSELGKLLKDKNRWIAQEFIEGEEYCVFSFFHKGENRAISVYKPKIRVGKGAGIYLEPVNVPELEKQVVSFGKSISFTGQLSFDFIERKGAFYAIECNPRATSGAHFIADKLANVLDVPQEIDEKSKKNIAVKLILFCVRPGIIFTNKWRQSRDVVWNKKDVRPSILQLVGIFEMLFIALKKRITPLEATTHDVAWNGEEMNESI